MLEFVSFSLSFPLSLVCVRACVRVCVCVSLAYYSCLNNTYSLQSSSRASSDGADKFILENKTVLTWLRSSFRMFPFAFTNISWSIVNWAGNKKTMKKCDVIWNRGTKRVGSVQTRGVWSGPTIFFANALLQNTFCHILCSEHTCKYYNKRMKTTGLRWNSLFRNKLPFRRWR